MAIPRTVTKILESRGAFLSHPERKRTNEPESGLVFPKNPPRRFTPEQRAAWRNIVKIVPEGVLTGSDVITVEVTAALLAEFREDPKAMPTARITRLTSELNKLGLTPSSRASLEIQKPEYNEFDDV